MAMNCTPRSIRSNFERYKPMVAAISQLDAKQLGALYIHYYPLFQQPYQILGYPNGYFNDRLVEVIDNLLATPEPKGPIELVRPNVMYTYADPALESSLGRTKITDPNGTGERQGDQGEADRTAGGDHRGAAQALASRSSGWVHVGRRTNFIIKSGE